MSIFKKMISLVTLCGLLCMSTQAEALTYVTDTGGYAYDQSRAVTNLAPAIALGTVAIVGIIAIAVQNSHNHSSSSSSSSSSAHYGSYNSSYYSSYAHN
jgi:hypothetical protein